MGSQFAASLLFPLVFFPLKLWDYFIYFYFVMFFFYNLTEDEEHVTTLERAHCIFFPNIRPWLLFLAGMFC